MIMAPTHERKQRMDTLKTVHIQKPEWKHHNLACIIRDKPIVRINGRKHYPVHWENLNYKDEYIDICYMEMMEDISKLKHKQHPWDELPPSPKQYNLATSRRKEALKRIHKTRVSWRTPPKPTPEERLQAVAQPEGSSPK